MHFGAFTIVFFFAIGLSIRDPRRWIPLFKSGAMCCLQALEILLVANEAIMTVSPADTLPAQFQKIYILREHCFLVATILIRWNFEDFYRRHRDDSSNNLRMINLFCIAVMYFSFKIASVYWTLMFSHYHTHKYIITTYAVINHVLRPLISQLF